MCAGIGLVLGSGVYTFRYAEGLSYFSNDPKACVNCHVMTEQYESWTKSSHRKAASCNDCHVPHDLVGKYLAKARNGWNHSKAFTLQDYPEPIRIKPFNLQTLQQNCVACHDTMVSEITAHKDLKGIDSKRCTECHRSVGHMNLD